MRRLFVLLLALCGCDVVDLPLVSVDAGEMFTPAMGMGCADNSQCMGGQFCDKPCGAAFGRCTQQPPFCDGEFRPECGCDGVTYWNPCLRRKAGVGMLDRGPCTNPLPCDTTSPCDAGVCGRAVAPNQCGIVPAGACFVLPDACETGGFMPDHFYECGTGMTQCFDACGAIRSGKIMARYPGPCP